MTTPNKDRTDFEAWATSENVGVDVRYNVSHVEAARSGYFAACANKNAIIEGLQGTVDSMAQTNAALIKRLKKITAPPSEGEIHGIVFDYMVSQNILLPNEVRRSGYLRTVTAAITKWQEMRS